VGLQPWEGEVFGKETEAENALKLGRSALKAGRNLKNRGCRGFKGGMLRARKNSGNVPTRRKKESRGRFVQGKKGGGKRGRIHRILGKRRGGKKTLKRFFKKPEKKSDFRYGGAGGGATTEGPPSSELKMGGGGLLRKKEKRLLGTIMGGGASWISSEIDGSGKEDQ